MGIVTIAADQLWGRNVSLAVAECELTTVEERPVVGLVGSQQCGISLSLRTVDGSRCTTGKTAGSGNILRCIRVEVGQPTEANRHAVGIAHLDKSLCIFPDLTAFGHDTCSTAIAFRRGNATVFLSGNLPIEGDRSLIYLVHHITYMPSVLVHQRKRRADFPSLRGCVTDNDTAVRTACEVSTAVGHPVRAELHTCHSIVDVKVTHIIRHLPHTVAADEEVAEVKITAIISRAGQTAELTAP